MKEDEIVINQNADEVLERNKFIAWVKENKTRLLLAGLSITTIMATILGIKNKDTLVELWNSLKKEIEKEALYSAKWFEKANLEDLQKAREIVLQDSLNPKLDLDYRSKCHDLLSKFDNATEKIKWVGREYGYPVQSSNGWHLPSDD